jgi:hypothetical protein
MEVIRDTLVPKQPRTAMSLSQEELRFRPFELLSFREPSADQIADGDVFEADAHAALQTRLAADGIESITPDTAENVLATFGLTRGARRAILIELWQHAFKKLLFRDDQVDTGEAAYLHQLGNALGLTAEELKVARLEVPEL